MLTISRYQEEFLEYLKAHSFKKEPERLYAPVQYILHLGGKRLRPVLTLLTTDIFGGDYRKALGAAMAVEVFHNFTLLHDDIMDDAPLRRGMPSVHEKWDVNTGILSGDVMLVLSYTFFESYDAELQAKLIRLFNKTAREVCEGQQYDMDFETRNDVTLPEYLKMIAYKTAVLVGSAMKMGAFIAGAGDEEAAAIYDFGLNLGIAFQLQDDYLDSFGDAETFGKKIGGDIIENKKTFLYLKALENLNGGEAGLLRDLYNTTPADTEKKIETVKALFVSSGAAGLIREEITRYTEKAFAGIESLSVDPEKKQLLLEFGKKLIDREV
ncbi:polyprenyl synthetase family protein [Sinomicrobium weinanense]|uniref:Polyprenyl synthetase family protein n=1 Tax=Sinomicrobium weinanense TaxID=2842200 RepID=A0A926JP58_9FLAO|nr:polyprenyl synthetase family protein [Sinomicrobium weinanense]MBC9794912.1 polyprenyl synthetase family protein [Sinomicrobium weinanense]MBU3125683.1 polyprenyl synthetase family protein [Sinomicrobium weinanense]